MCITLYSNDDCRFCRAAKQLLARRRLPYTVVELPMDDAGRDNLLRRTGRMTFPQVIVDGHPIGGYRELEALVRRNTPAPCG